MVNIRFENNIISIGVSLSKPYSEDLQVIAVWFISSYQYIEHSTSGSKQTHIIQFIRESAAWFSSFSNPAKYFPYIIAGCLSYFLHSSFIRRYSVSCQMSDWHSSFSFPKFVCKCIYLRRIEFILSNIYIFRMQVPFAFFHQMEWS